MVRLMNSVQFSRQILCNESNTRECESGAIIKKIAPVAPLCRMGIGHPPCALNLVELRPCSILESRWASGVEHIDQHVIKSGDDVTL